ncbi:FliI/YscN family ATPase [Microbulbifer sp. ANSA003]|uniref:FliI/YscN family ATPase n=1 Tax=unclassified Microbulbifer TaxID=2619833 RepID=UPI00403AA314
MICTDLLIQSIQSSLTISKYGKIVGFHGSTFSAVGLDSCVGDICLVSKATGGEKVQAEVIGFEDDRLLLMPLGSIVGLRAGDKIEKGDRVSTVNCGEHLIGRVIDPFGSPLDGRGEVRGSAINIANFATPVNPFSREKTSEIVHTQVPVIDSLLTVGFGQRIGIFSGSGVGKTTLLGALLKGDNFEINVIALIGERGREVTEFVEDVLGSEGLSKSIIVVATPDQSPLVRVYAAITASKIAEFYCKQGNNVLLTMDSITRLAMAQREIGLSRGEPPSFKGYTPSCYSMLPDLIERAGNFKERGSITAYYTVLVEGDDMSDPIADYMRGILDGHFILNREIAAQGKYPAIDLLNSVSRLLTVLATKEELNVIRKIKNSLSLFDEAKTMIKIGAYKKGDEPDLDKSIVVSSKVDQLLYSGERNYRDVILKEFEKLILELSL